jgi:hypothetical protein
MGENMPKEKLLNEEDYKQARNDEFVWQQAKALGTRCNS